MADKDPKQNPPREKDNLKDAFKTGGKGTEKVPTPPGQKK